MAAPVPSSRLRPGPAAKACYDGESGKFLAYSEIPVNAAARPLQLLDLDRRSLEGALAARGYQRFHAGQIFQWVYRRAVTDPAAMTDLPRELRQTLAAEAVVALPALASRDISVDGTEKFLFELDDRRRIESVFIPDTPAMTFCISTQVGCAMACAFCLTGRMGLVRQLTAGEIVGQVLALARHVDLAGKPFNVVFMGMGEPLHNYDETMTALRILTDAHGFAIGPRRITLSTVGLPPAIERLGREPIMPNIAVSLHAPTDALRAELVPIARKYGIADIIAVCKRLPLRKRSRITFEYVLLAGVNDRLQDARRLARLLGGLKSKVNLIPLNEAPGIPFRRPSDEAIDAFARTLADHGAVVSVRKSRGRDIRAACGQLIVEGSRKSAAQRLAVRM
ncbi:MAG: 23S rRNA (adenine(2503)-C(2))-methyltransferase RlmN [Acidobacteria bacterium]|nr:23S rRNA (adenine(2503)-C(2))-methyltransferase RlmN [Acidobacteriota bacterium]